MCEAPGSVVTLLCSGIQLYSAERRIADCILADVKRASMCTSAELARLSSSSEATITRLCHKLGFENYRKFQLALARDAMEQQETARRTREEGQDELRQALLDIQANREEESCGPPFRPSTPGSCGGCSRCCAAARSSRWCLRAEAFRWRWMHPSGSVIWASGASPAPSTKRHWLLRRR